MQPEETADTCTWVGFIQYVLGMFPSGKVDGAPAEESLNTN
jgi:hypothetical protein